MAEIEKHAEIGEEIKKYSSEVSEKKNSKGVTKAAS